MPAEVHRYMTILPALIAALIAQSARHLANEPRASSRRRPGARVLLLVDKECARLADHFLYQRGPEQVAGCCLPALAFPSQRPTSVQPYRVREWLSFRRDW